MDVLKVISIWRRRGGGVDDEGDWSLFLLRFDGGVGGFVIHCGWNSVGEAAKRGIPVLAWPQHGDQRVNAEIVEKAGLGIWERSWGWGVESLVTHEEIHRKFGELMEDKNLRSRAKLVGIEAQNAGNIGGSSNKTLTEILELFKSKA